MTNTITTTHSTHYGGPGFCTLLTLIFITLKLLNKITWGWLWVLSPLWIPLSIALIIAFILVIVAGIVAAIRQ